MAPANSQWPLFYQGLQQLGQPLNGAAAAVNIENALEHSRRLTSLLLTLAAQNSATIVAQLNLTPRQLPVGLARLVKTLALGIIFSRSYGWQARRNQQFLQAIILPGAFIAKASSLQQAQLLTAKALQQFDKHHPLLALLIATCNAGRQPTWHLHPDGPLLTLASQLALKLLPATGSQLSLEQLLLDYQTTQADIVQANWYGLLQQLAKTKTLPGRFAREQHTSKSSTNYWFISGIAVAEHKQPLLVYARLFDPASKTIASDVQQLPLAELNMLNPQYFRDAGWLDLLEPAGNWLPATAEFSLETCLAQSQYNLLLKLGLSSQVQQLESQPILSQFLQRSAQHISRQQLPVSRLRHAISMLGQDALSDWVAQAELHQYCSRLAHPHQQWLEQLQQCLQQALLLLSNATGQPLTISTAGVIARCACLSLWQQSSMPDMALGRHVRGHLLLGQKVQQHVWQAADYPVQLSHLLLHYQQSAWAKAALNWHHQQHPPLTLLLRLSWQLSLAVFCASEQNQQRLGTLLPVATARLGLPVQPAGYWQQRLMASSQCCCPLPVM